MKDSTKDILKMSFNRILHRWALRWTDEMIELQGYDKVLDKQVWRAYLLGWNISKVLYKALQYREYRSIGISSKDKGFGKFANQSLCIDFGRDPIIHTIFALVYMTFSRVSFILTGSRKDLSLKESHGLSWEL